MSELIRQHKSYFSLFMFVVLLATTVAAWRPIAEPWVRETSQDAGLILTHISVSGANKTPDAAVQAVLDVDIGMPLLAVSLPSLQSRIEALPWIERAELTRHMSGELQIMIFERVPFALLQQSGDVWLVDASGTRITNKGLMAFEALPLIVGPATPAQIQTLGRYAKLSTDLSQKLVSGVRIDARRWDLVFENGIRVKMADDQNKTYGLDQSWQRLMNLDQTLQLLRREVAVVDLRLEDRLVVRLTPEGRKRMNGSELAL